MQASDDGSDTSSLAFEQIHLGIQDDLDLTSKRPLEEHLDTLASERPSENKDDDTASVETAFEIGDTPVSPVLSSTLNFLVLTLLSRQMIPAMAV